MNLPSLYVIATILFNFEKVDIGSIRLLRNELDFFSFSMNKNATFYLPKWYPLYDTIIFSNFFDMEDKDYRIYEFLCNK